MIFIDFKVTPYRTDLVMKYVEWLIENAEPFDLLWDWKLGETGDMPDGVYFEDEAMAIVFKLRFGL